MKWYRDLTGRFAERPHYELAELDAECEGLVSAFLRKRHGVVAFPIATNDLTILLEERVGNLDIYADLSDEGPAVEGVTDFYPGKKPDVRIARALSEDPRRENRYRTTLTHELGHVHLHTFLWETRQTLPLPLFGTAEADPVRCKRDSMLGAPPSDWMEWQAGYTSGAVLMPVSLVRELVRGLHGERGTSGIVARSTVAGEELIARMQSRFAVSADAARVRLLKLGYLTENAPSRPLGT